MTVLMAGDQASGRRWYVVYTLPHRESLALEHLERQNFHCFLPRHLKTIRHARKLRTNLSPLFPRYLFASLDLDVDRWKSVNGTVGVVRLIMAHERPLAVPEGVVESLITATGKMGDVQFEDLLKVGQTVRVNAGPFTDIIGTLDRLDDRGRVEVLLHIMNASVRTRLPRGWVEPSS
jgi:transcriptional antiterminator RfaH